MPAECLLRLENCSKFFLTDYDVGRRYLFARIFWRRRELPAKFHALAVYPLRNIHLRIRGGEKLNVVGPAGAGKTMLGYLLAGLLAPSSGRLERVGRVAYFSRLVNFVPPLMTAREYVGFSVFLSGLGGEVDDYSVDEVLSRAGLREFEKRYLRDVPARLLENLHLELLSRSRMKAVVLDEPRDDVWDAFARREDFDALTIVVLSRRPRGDLEAFDRIAVMSAGRILHDGAWRDGLAVYDRLSADGPERPAPARAEATEPDDDLDLDEIDGSPSELGPDDIGEDGAEPSLRTSERSASDSPPGEEINARIRRTAPDRRGKGAARIDAVWTTPDATPEELEGRLTLVSGKAQTLYVWLRVLDAQLTGSVLSNLAVRLSNSRTEARLTLSSRASGRAPTLDHERACLAFPIDALGLAPGDYNIRLVAETSDGVQDRVSMKGAVSVVMTP